MPAYFYRPRISSDDGFGSRNDIGLLTESEGVLHLHLFFQRLVLSVREFFLPVSIWSDFVHSHLGTIGKVLGTYRKEPAFARHE